VYISNTTRTFAIVFLLITLVYSYPSKDIVSYELPSSNPDNSFITKTTDCITSMMTSTIIGTDADCFSILDIKDYISKHNVSAINDINSLSKNNSVYFNIPNIQNKINANTSAIPIGAINPVNTSPVSSGSATPLPSPPKDNPPTTANPVNTSPVSSGSATPLPPKDNPPTTANPVNTSPVSSGSATPLPPQANPLETINSQQQNQNLPSDSSSNKDTNNDDKSSDGNNDGNDNDD
jgi:hypothetical protein